MIRNLLIVILFFILSSDALALTYPNSTYNFNTEWEAYSACLVNDSEVGFDPNLYDGCKRNPSNNKWIYFRESSSYPDDGLINKHFIYEAGSECTLVGGVCQDPASDCTTRQSSSDWAVTWDSSTTSNGCATGCEYTYDLAICGSGTCSALGIEWTGNTCTGGNGTEVPDGAPQDCVTNANGDITCVGDMQDTYNGNPLPEGDLPDNSCEYLSDGSFVCDQPVGDTSNGSNTQELQDDNNPAYPQTVHNDYTSLPPGTGVDTNGDGVTDALTQDTTGDGLTDNIINADGTNFLTTDTNGTVDDSPNPGTINDDGSYNDGESQTAGNEDGTGEGLGECTDDPGTAEDECGDINKSGATTPYCDSEPTCEGDPLQCAQIFQLWQNLCVWHVPETMTGSLLVDEPGVDDGSSFFNESTDIIDVSTFDLNDTGWGYARTCPSDIPITNSFGTFTVALSDYCGLFEVMSYFVLLLGALISGRIFVMGIA